MTYIPHTPDDRQSMLADIGAPSVAALFDDVPAQHRFPALNIPKALSEMEVMAELRDMAEANTHAGRGAMFLGAGAYHHFSPSTVNAIIQRGEFLTAYTPYQPEVSQGTLQAIFEYQSMVCALTGMEAANASHYDGATALAEAVIMAHHHFRETRKKVVLAGSIHPHYRAVVRTYIQGMGITIEGDAGPAAPEAIGSLEPVLAAIDGGTSLVAVQYPNFFGQIEDYARLITVAKAADALVCLVCDPIALGLFKSPGELGADIACGEGQSLGLPLSYGGPYLGFFATRKAYVRKMAGRLVGEAKDKEGRRGYVLTLATREQHIRREKATSNICTNQGLMALAASVYLSTLGKNGLKRVAELCWHKSHYAAEQIAALPGYRVVAPRPFFKEFVVACPQPVAVINERLVHERQIIGGYDLGQEYPALAGHMLLAVTETNTREQIDELVDALKVVG